MREVAPIPSYIADNADSWADYITELMSWLVTTQLTERQKTRLYGFQTYKDITHELYYHLGMYFKKRMLFLKRMARKALLLQEYRKELTKLRTQQQYSTAIQPFVGQESDTTRLQVLEEKLREFAPLIQLEDGSVDVRNYQAYKKAEEDYHRIWSLIRGQTPLAIQMREAIATFAKTIQYGNFYPEELEEPQDQVVTDFLAGKGEFDHDFDSTSW